MKIDEKLIARGRVDGALNEAQEALIKGEESQTNVNLFLLLRGISEPNVQMQIVANYNLLAQYHKEKREEDKKEPVVAKLDKAELTIYCDGACKGNPGESGSGLAIYKGDKKPKILYGQYKENGTNNTAELNALHKALLIAQEEKDLTVIIYCDSMYSIDCITKWAYSWKAKGWRKKGGEIKNLEIIQEAHALYETLKERVGVKHVKAHAGFEGNELADRMAMHTISEKNEEYRVYKYKSIEDVLAMSVG